MKSINSIIEAAEGSFIAQAIAESISEIRNLAAAASLNSLSKENLKKKRKRKNLERKREMENR